MKNKNIIQNILVPVFGFGLGEYNIEFGDFLVL